MRCSILALALTLACTSAPGPTPAPAPQTPATGSQPQLGRAVEADPPPEPEEPSDEVDPEPIEPAVTSNPPLPEFATEDAPPSYRVRVTTTVGDFVVAVDRNLAPNGAKRFYNLARLGYYRDATFFRAIQGFMVQFGLHGDPGINAAWKLATIPDDPVATPNVRGTVVFAKSAQKDSATTQLFINLVDNTQLDNMGFAPFGHVVEGMDVVDKVYTGYGEGAPRGRGPSQARITNEGEPYLQQFPELTRITDMQTM